MPECVLRLISQNPCWSWIANRKPPRTQA
ncbi:hypothetical protein LINPERPRIM_LOCUS17143 [Linum perenne]